MVFKLDDDDELQRLRSWDEKHLKEQHNDHEPYGGAIGGRIVFTIASTSLGQILGVECASCRAKGKPRSVFTETLTDFSDW